MQINGWLHQNTALLATAGIDTARLDCLVLLEDAIGKDRAWLLAHPEFRISSAVLGELDRAIFRRKEHEPLAYIRGKAEFYGRKFIVNKNVLVPRPESESIIELLKEYVPRPDLAVIADIGTGSGALAISVKLELPAARVVATDIDARCVLVAGQNAIALNAAIDFLVGDLLQPFAGNDTAVQPTVLLCNLPYIPQNYPINLAAMQEPTLALFGGPDGLDCYRKLCAQLTVFNRPPVAIITESLRIQHANLATIFSQFGYTLQITDGLVQLFEYKNS